MQKKIFVAVMMSLVLFLVLTSTQAQAGPIEIKVSHATSLQSTKGQTWEYFKKITEERLAGKVVVSHHHSAQLYGQKEGIQALQAGAVQLISPGAALMTGDFPKMALFALPFLFNDEEDMRTLAKHPLVKQKIFDEMPKKGLKFVAFWLNGFRFAGASKHPIRKLEDFGDIKIRVAGGKVYRDTFKALGANVVAVSWSEIVPALQQGTVDAVEPTASNWESEKLYEIAKYITFTNHLLSSYIVATNDAWWKSLPNDIRGELEKLLDETTDYNWKMTKEENQRAIERMKATGNVQFFNLTKEERKRWAEKVKPVHKEYESIIGKDLMDIAYKIIQ